MSDEERIQALLHFQQIQEALETRIKRERDSSPATVDGDYHDEIQWTGTRPAKRGKAMPTVGDEVIVLDDEGGDEVFEVED
jgi:hypothetical protein